MYWDTHLPGEEGLTRNSFGVAVNLPIIIENKPGYTAQEAPSMRSFHLRK